MHPRAVALAVLALAALPATLAAPAAVLGGYEATGCAYVYAPAVANGLVARGEVPAGFRVLGEPGAAALIVATVTCDVAVDGGAPRRATWTDVGVLVDAPDGVPGFHLYLLWELTDSPALGGLLAAAGIAHEVTPGVRMDADTTSLVATSGAEAAWSGGAYALEGAFAGFHEAASGTVAWWHHGPRGTVRLDQTFLHDAAHGEAHGLAELRATGRLAELTGPLQVVEANLPIANLSAIVRRVG